jgi:serine protease Do
VLGITMQDSVNGAVITGVATGSGAANAGLKVGDIITKINNKDVASSSDVGSIISTLKPDTEVTVVILRSGKTQTVTATLGRR